MLQSPPFAPGHRCSEGRASVANAWCRSVERECTPHVRARAAPCWAARRRPVEEAARSPSISEGTARRVRAAPGSTTLSAKLQAKRQQRMLFDEFGRVPAAPLREWRYMTSDLADGPGDQDPFRQAPLDPSRVAGAAEVVDGYRPAETAVDLGAEPDDFSVKGVLGRLAVGPFQQTSGAKHVARFEVLPRRRDEHRCRPLVATWFALPASGRQ